MPEWDVFSRRIPLDLRPNAITRARAERADLLPFDLTVSNPTLCRIPYPAELLEPLGHLDGLVYRPDPLGLEGARQAVAEEYRRHGLEVDPRAIVLTASTSEAYSFLFKLLCDPGDGDAIFAPVPSYPLFEHLASLDGVVALPYPLDPAEGWRPDLDGLGAEGARARAVIAVHPNNPTGSYLVRAAARDLVGFCQRRDLALIVDEVFVDYPLVDVVPAPSFAATREVLTFTLGGLSKHIGLPQAKLAWTVVSGPEQRVEEALERLAYIADNYLSVSTPVQLSLRQLFQEGATVRRAIRERCRLNLETLRDAARAVPGVSFVPPQAGWSAVLRFPGVISEETLVIRLLEDEGVAVHPGYFFDFPDEGYLALSLLPPAEVFAEGVGRLLGRIAAML